MKNLLNLYTEELRDKPLPYGFSWLAGSIAAVTVLLVVQAVYIHSRLAVLEAEHQTLDERKHFLNSSIKFLEEKIATEDQRQRFEQEMASLLADIHGRERVLAEMNALLDHPMKGFSSYLQALAAASGHGVWLTNIHLQSASTGQDLDDIRLIGRMHQGDKLPRYIDALSRTEALQGLRFNSVHALRVAPESGGNVGSHNPMAQGRIVLDEPIIFLLSTRPNDALGEVKP